MILDYGQVTDDQEKRKHIKKNPIPFETLGIDPTLYSDVYKQIEDVKAHRKMLDGAKPSSRVPIEGASDDSPIRTSLFNESVLELSLRLGVLELSECTLIGS